MAKKRPLTIAEIEAWARNRGANLDPSKAPKFTAKDDKKRRKVIQQNAQARQKSRKKKFETVGYGNTKKAQKARDDARLNAELASEGKKGKGFKDLSEGQGKGQQSLRDARRADKESKALGGERKESESFLVKTLNFIGRPMFAAAEAVNDNQEKYYRERHKGKSKLEAVGSGFKAGFGGFGEGISGKKKTTFSKVIQEVANNQKANRLGVGAANSDTIKPAKVNKVLKHGLGLTLDIFADPLTYTGVGLVAKAAGAGGRGVIKADAVVDNLIKTADVQKKVVNSGKATKQQLDELMAVNRAPVEAIGRLDRAQLERLKSNPQAYALYKQIKAERKAGPNFKRKGAGETKHLGSTVKGLALKDGKPDAKVKVALEELGNVAAKRHYDEAYKAAFNTEFKSGKHGGWNNLAEFGKKYGTKSEAYRAAKIENARTLAKAQSVARQTATKRVNEAGLTADAMRADLAEATLRNLSPDISKQLRLRLGTASVGVKGTEKIGELLGKARHGKAEKAADSFNKHFRALAGVNPTLGMLRNQELGRSSNRIRAHLVMHQRVWDPVPKPAAAAVLKDWRKPTPNGSVVPAGVHPLKGSIDNAVQHFDEEVKNIQATIDELGITPNEFGAWIKDPKMRINAETAGWNFDTKTGKALGAGAENWFINYLKNNDKLDNPGRILFQSHAALEHVLAKRAVNQSALDHFGVPVRKSTEYTGHTGSTDLRNRLASDLKEQGYVKIDPKVIPGVSEDVLFHPEIAEGLIKVNQIMNDRVTMDKWLRTFDQGNQIFKSVVTRYNPSFHVRTLLSEQMLSYIGGIRNPMWANAAAGKVMRGRNREFTGAGAVDVGVAERLAASGDRAAIGAANTLTGGAPVGGEGAKTVLRHKKFGDLTADQVWGIYKSSGLKTGFATTDVARNMDIDRKGNFVTKINDKLQDRFEDAEDFGRLAHFMDVIKHSKAKTLDEAIEEATEVVLKYHLDYTAVTQFEKTWATRAMPFYKWLRLSTPMIIESLAHNPGKAMVAPKVLAEASRAAGYDIDGFGIAPGGADVLTPSWLREAGALPMFDAFGDNQFFNPAQTVPLYSVLQEGNRVAGEEGEPAPKSVAMSAFSKLTPFLRVPGELATDQSSVGAPPSSNYLRYFTNQAPQTAVGGRLAGGTSDVDPKQQLLSFLTNPGIQPVTEGRLNSEAIRQRQLAIEHRRALKKKLGIE